MAGSPRWNLPYLNDASPLRDLTNDRLTEALDGSLGKALTVASQPARLALSVPAGLLVREADTRRFWGHDGAGWVYLGGGVPPVEQVSMLSGWNANSDGITQAVPTVSRSGGIVTMQGVTVNRADFKVGSGDQMCQVPVGYRPNGTVIFTGYCGLIKTNIYHLYRFDIGSDGIVRLINMIVGGVDRAANDQWSVSASWTAA